MRISPTIAILHSSRLNRNALLINFAMSWNYFVSAVVKYHERCDPIAKVMLLAFVRYNMSGWEWKSDTNIGYSRVHHKHWIPKYPNLLNTQKRNQNIENDILYKSHANRATCETITQKRNKILKSFWNRIFILSHSYAYEAIHYHLTDYKYIVTN